MTKETEKAFQILYCEYKRRRKSGLPKQDAVCFEDAAIGAIAAFSKWLPADISYAMQELKNSDFINIDILGDVELLESGIEFMEAKPKDFFRGVADFFDLGAILGFVTGI